MNIDFKNLKVDSSGKFESSFSLNGNIAKIKCDGRDIQLTKSNGKLEKVTQVFSLKDFQNLCDTKNIV